jgi:hypothetical protein
MSEEPESPQCPTAGCEGRMVDVQPIETARSDEYVLIRIECTVCHARAWRIARPTDEREDA